MSVVSKAWAQKSAASKAKAVYGQNAHLTKTKGSYRTFKREGKAFSGFSAFMTAGGRMSVSGGSGKGGGIKHRPAGTPRGGEFY